MTKPKEEHIMTCKQIRNNQLEELKQADNISTATYRVEVLNGAFLPVVITLRLMGYPARAAFRPPS